MAKKLNPEIEKLLQQTGGWKKSDWPKILQDLQKMSKKEKKRLRLI